MYIKDIGGKGDVEDGEIVMTLPLTDNPKVGMLTADDEDMEDSGEHMKNIITVQHTQSVHHTNGMIGSWTDWDIYPSMG